MLRLQALHLTLSPGDIQDSGFASNISLMPSLINVHSSFFQDLRVTDQSQQLQSRGSPGPERTLIHSGGLRLAKLSSGPTLLPITPSVPSPTLSFCQRGPCLTSPSLPEPALLPTGCPPRTGLLERTQKELLALEPQYPTRAQAPSCPPALLAASSCTEAPSLLKARSSHELVAEETEMPLLEGPGLTCVPLEAPRSLRAS